MKRFSIKGGVWRSNESLFRPMTVESNAVAVVSGSVPVGGKESMGEGGVSVMKGGMLSLAVTAVVPASGGVAAGTESCMAGMPSAAGLVCPQAEGTPPCMSKMPGRMSEWRYKSLMRFNFLNGQTVR